jgi:hypothetical protein
MFLRMCGQWRQFKRLLALLVWFRRSHRVRLISLTSLDSWLWCGRDTQTSSLLKLSVHFLNRLIHSGETQLPLFLRAHEIIHSKCNLLHFWAFVHIIEVHDFNLPELSEDDDGRPPLSDSIDDEYLSFDHGWGNLRSWPKVSRFVSDNGSTNSSWPSLPFAGSKVWLSSSPAVGWPATSLMGGPSAGNLPTWGAVPEKVTVFSGRKEGGMVALRASPGACRGQASHA